VGILRALPHHVDGVELLAPTSLLEEVIAEGLKAQENTPCTHHQLDEAILK